MDEPVSRPRHASRAVMVIALVFAGIAVAGIIWQQVTGGFGPSLAG